MSAGGGPGAGEGRAASRLVAVALLATLLFGYPLLAVFDSAALVLGMPVLWLYLLGSWALVVALAAWAVRGG